MMATTYTQIDIENQFLKKYGKRKFPLRRVEEMLVAVLIFFFYCIFLTKNYFPPRLWTNYVTIVVRKYLPQTQEIKDVVQDLISAGIPNFMYNKYTSGLSGKTVFSKI